jgi:hypothetical protein
MLYIVGATAATLFVSAFKKRDRFEPVRESNVRAVKLKAAARKVDSSAAAVEVALKPLMAA